MRLTFLGTSAAEGYPSLFCSCANCTAARTLGGPSLRKRSAALINTDLLIDLGPDLIAASHAHSVDLTAIRYLLQTHEHSDHFDPNHVLWRYPGFSNSDLPILAWHATAGALDKARRLLAATHLFLEGAFTDTDVARARLTLHPIAPYQSFAVGPYRVTPIRANHGGPTELVLLHLIDDGERTIFYCTDTGPLDAAAWQTLRRAGRPIDLLVMDETDGFGAPGGGHLNADLFLQHVAHFRAQHLLAPNARIVAHHFSHQHNPPYPQLTEFFAPHGVEVAYDGLVIDL